MIEATLMIEPRPPDRMGLFARTDLEAGTPLTSDRVRFSFPAAGLGVSLWPQALLGVPTSPTTTTLFMGVGTNYGTPGLWRSTDGGATWDKSQQCEPQEFNSQYGFFGGETWLWQARSGKVWHAESASTHVAAPAIRANFCSI
mgnify:CR=1 FL=1